MDDLKTCKLLHLWKPLAPPIEAHGCPPKKGNWGGGGKKRKKDLHEAYEYYSLVDKVLGIEFQIQYSIVEPMPTILLKCGGVVVCKIIPNCKILSPRMKTL
jgi:hypothetical protein